MTSTISAKRVNKTDIVNYNSSYHYSPGFAYFRFYRVFLIGRI